MQFKFKSGLEIVQRASKPRTYSKADVTIATDRIGKDKSGVQNFALRIGVSMEILDKVRYRQGDRIDVLVDEQARMVLLRRTTDGRGWSLSNPSSKRLSIQLTWVPGLPSVPKTLDCLDVKATENGILFRLPDEAVFGEACARSEDPERQGHFTLAQDVINLP